jgi:hypothetical protein
MNVDRKKKFIFFFHGESALRAPATHLHLGTLMDIGGLAQRTESYLSFSFFLFFSHACCLNIPRSVDVKQHTMREK